MLTTSTTPKTSKVSKTPHKEDRPLLNLDRIKFVKKSDSKKRVFEILAELLASGQKNVTKNEIFDALIAREKLGNTVIGNGVAVPRASINITRPRAALVFLKKGIQLDSPDKQPTHLFLALLLPDKELIMYANILKKINFTISRESIIDDISEHKNPQILIDYFDKFFITETEDELEEVKS